MVVSFEAQNDRKDMVYEGTGEQDPEKSIGIPSNAVYKLGGVFKYFSCLPLLGEMIQFDEYIYIYFFFQMG